MKNIDKTLNMYKLSICLNKFMNWGKYASLACKIHAIGHKVSLKLSQYNAEVFIETYDFVFSQYQ